MTSASSTALALVDRADGVLVPVRVVPRAGRTTVAGVRAGALVVKLAAPPVEGAANQALVRLMADLLGLPSRHVLIVSGERSRDKRILVRTMSALDVDQRLSAILNRV